MTRSLSIALAVMVVLGGCGTGADADCDGSRAVNSTDHVLEVTVDGRMLRASGRPARTQVDHGRAEIRIVVGGSLAWNEGPGAEQMTASLVANDIAEGSYLLVGSESEVLPGHPRRAWLRLAIDGAIPVGLLEPMDGVLVVSDARGTFSGGRYRLLEASGSLRGKFVDVSGLEHYVEGSFRYAR